MILTCNFRTTPFQSLLILSKAHSAFWVGYIKCSLHKYGIIDVRIDESGCLSIWKLPLTQKTKKTLGHLELQCNRELRGFQIVSKDLGPVAAIARLSKGYVALVAPRLKQDGDKVEHVLSVWDELYGTLQAERLIEIGNAGGFRKDECAYTVSLKHDMSTVSEILIP